MSSTNTTRKHIRFDPDPLEIATIGVLNEQNQYVPQISALILNKAPMSGCCLVTYRHFDVDVGKVYVVKMGALNPLKAEIRWFQPIDNKLIKIGFKFLE